MQKITPFLWFDKETEGAMNFCISIFDGAPNESGDSKVINIAR